MSAASKRDKRIARQKERVKKAQQKKVRQFENPQTHKSIKQAEDPSAQKKVKAKHPGSRRHRPMSWAKDHEDREGAWSWGDARDWGDRVSSEEIYPFLDGYSGELWNRILEEKAANRHRHICYDTGQLKPEAQRRLVELSLDDNERIFRFRMTGKKRLYGFLFGGTVFFTVWFDPTHSIYKSTK